MELVDSQASEIEAWGTLSSVRGGLTSMSTADIKSRQWSDAEKQAIRRASGARAAGLDLPEKEFEEIPRLTEAQLAKLVHPRQARRKVAVSVVSTRKCSIGCAPRAKATNPHQRYSVQPDGSGKPHRRWKIMEF